MFWDSPLTQPPVAILDRYIVMPRSYGYGASMGAWILDYFGGWAGEWSQVAHSNCSYRCPAFTGDFNTMTSNVVDKIVDEQGRNLVQVDFKMSSQLGVAMATAKTEIELPKKQEKIERPGWESGAFLLQRTPRYEF